MKGTLAALLLFSATYSFCQTDTQGNPVFNSVSIGEDTIGDLKLLANYYTLKNNIDNKRSSVYISDNPTLDEISNAIKLPSDFFVLMNGQNVVCIIMPTIYPENQITVLDPDTRQLKHYKSSIKGDISENRANELVKEKYDSSATIEKEKLVFNNRKLRITPNREIKRAVMDLIAKEKLGDRVPSKMKILSKDELRTQILKETREGGKMDFFNPIKGHEYEGVQVRPGIIGTKLEIALMAWGRACFELGVNTEEDALSIFAEFKGRPLNVREQETIKRGFEKGLQ